MIKFNKLNFLHREWLIYDQVALTELQKAVDSRQEYTSSFTLTENVNVSPNVKGYDQKVVALISPSCISACDGMAILLKGAKRATLIGTSTNGTGAGFIGGGSFEEVYLMKDSDHIIQLRVPNRLFGYGGKVDEFVFPENDSYITMNAENKPVKGDILYSSTIEDYLNGDKSWFDNAIEQLQ